MESLECGAASLCMILAHHGRWVPLAQLRQECGVSRDGTTLNALAKAAEGHGLKARALRLNAGHLETLACPLIAFWNYEHFLVVERMSARRVWINDPAVGRRAISRAEFEENFSHIVVELVPRSDFVAGGVPPQPIRRMAARLTGSSSAIGFIVASAVAVGLLGFALLAFTQIFIDHILSQGQLDWALMLIVAMLGTLVLRGLLAWMGRYYVVRLKAALVAGLAVALVERMLSLPLRFFAMRDVGDVAGRLKAIDNVGNAISVHLAGLMIGLVTAFIYTAAFLFYDPLLVAVALASLALTLGLTAISLSWFLNAGGTMVMYESRLASAAINTLRVIETVKSMGLEGGVFRRLMGLHTAVAAQRYRVELGHALLNIAPRFVADLGALAILGIGIARVMNGALSLGELVAFQALLGTAQASIVALLSEAGRLQTECAELIKIDDVFQHPVGVAIMSTPDSQLRLDGSIEFRDVTFGFNSAAPPLIENLSFKVEAGHQVALVGATGSGKSTVAQLLTGLYRPWSGSILFGGVPAECLPADLRIRMLAAVDQQIRLFEGTVRDNMTLWDATVPEAVLHRAAVDAEIHDVILGRVGGYDATVAEAGSNFSGGQAQRLDLARALVGDPAILVLDEATAALDPLIEEKILGNLYRRGMTRFIVAHRLSAIRDSDTILVLHDGQVIERGTHESLMRVGAAYGRLLRAE